MGDGRKLYRLSLSQLKRACDFILKPISCPNQRGRRPQSALGNVQQKNIDRHVDYYNGWNEAQERELFAKLSGFSGKFILSTWHHNDYRENKYVKSLWSQHKALTREHFYHVGGKETNRNPMVEALITNFNALPEIKTDIPAQYSLFDVPLVYGASSLLAPYAHIPITVLPLPDRQKFP